MTGEGSCGRSRSARSSSRQNSRAGDPPVSRLWRGDIGSFLKAGVIAATRRPPRAWPWQFSPRCRLRAWRCLRAESGFLLDTPQNPVLREFAETESVVARGLIRSLPACGWPGPRPRLPASAPTGCEARPRGRGAQKVPPGGRARSEALARSIHERARECSGLNEPLAISRGIRSLPLGRVREAGFCRADGGPAGCGAPRSRWP